MNVVAPTSILPNLKADCARPTRVVSAPSWCRWVHPQEVDPLRWEGRHRQLSFVVGLDRNNKCELHLVLLHREISFRSHVHAVPADERPGQRRAPRGRARSSAPGAQPAYNPPRRVDSRLPDCEWTLSTLSISKSTCCGVVQLYGSSSSLSTLGVGRWSGLPRSLWAVIASVCLTFKLLSTTTTSVSEMLVTRNLPPRRSPRWTVSVSLLPLSWRIAVSTWCTV